MSENIAYFNDRFIPVDQAVVPIEERGLQLGDGVYEVLCIYNGVPFTLKEHLDRLEQSANAIEIDLPQSKEKLAELAWEGIRKAGIENGTLYMQITRGTAPRNHLIPHNITPNLYLVWKHGAPDFSKYKAEGAAVFTVADERWKNCYIKSINLLPNLLAKEQAKRKGGQEALLVQGEWAKEGSSSNLFIVKNGHFKTPQADHSILKGITRQKLIALLEENQIEVSEQPISLAEVLAADEVFMTSTTMEVLPVVSIDGKQIGEGKPGEYFRKLTTWFRELVAQECEPGTIKTV
ncbi:D-amino-acid transaminase [Brevibacillus fluminis]|uniref:D-amino-acid transaminase n=1 Tax=Brevibacillus fluminis TaxID=511487 RepID=UPI003F88E9A3